MRAVGIKVLKNKLSEYLRLVAAGETVQVTDRDTIVAELVPPRRGAKHDPKAAWQELIRQGIVTPARNRGMPLPPKDYPPIMTLEELMAELDQDRADR